MNTSTDQIEKELLEVLGSAIIYDTEQSLVDSKNAFTASSEDDACKCYHNMHAMLRMIQSKPNEAKPFAHLIKSHNQAKQCEHIWYYKQTLRALKEYTRPREF